MSKLPESVVREMESFHRDSCYPECGNESASDAASRVILALAENLPDDAVHAAMINFTGMNNYLPSDAYKMRGAIIAALRELGVDK